MTVHSRGVKPPLSPDTDALTKAPPVPRYLAPQAKAEWKRIMPQLIARRVITKADLAGVENYCICIGTVRQIEEDRAGGQIVNERSKLTRFQRLNLTHLLWRKAPSRAALV